MNSVLVDLGFMQIHWYSVMILIGIVIAYSLIIKEANRFKINKNFIFNLIFYVLIVGFLGARLYYVLFEWNYYSNNLSEIFAIWNGGLAIHGGIIGGLLVVLLFTKKYKVNFFRMTDIIVPGLIIAQAIGRWGNFFNSEAHGPAVSLEFLESLHLPSFIIEGMYIGGTYYHPTFLYESLWCLLGFIIIIITRKFKNINVGVITGFYLIWYSIGRFLIESLRTDSLMFMDLKIAQIISLLMILGGVIIIIISAIKYFPKYNDIKNLKEINY